MMRLLPTFLAIFIVAATTPPAHALFFPGILSSQNQVNLAGSHAAANISGTYGCICVATSPMIAPSDTDTSECCGSAGSATLSMWALMSNVTIPPGTPPGCPSNAGSSTGSSLATAQTVPTLEVCEGMDDGQATGFGQCCPEQSWNCWVTDVTIN